MRLRHLILAPLIALGLTAPQGTVAQGLFSPVITVNDAAITGYEIDQRTKLLSVFRTPGDLPALAREQLIEERLKAQALNAAGLQLNDEGTLRAMTEFAARANLELDQFLTILAQNGVDEETLRDYVIMGIAWRDYIRARFSSRVEVTDADVDAALGQSTTGSDGIEVLLSEIIIPAPPPQAASALATAERISRLTSTSAFEAEARRVSALPSKVNGGRLDWLPISNYPPQFRPLLLSLSPGEVTPPIQIPNGVALFQMRAVREVPRAPEPPAAIDYAAFYIAGGQSEAGLAEAARVRARVDTCDDLYGVARGLPPEQLERDSLPPEQIPQDVALELAKLDPGEVSTALTRSNGQTLVFLMMCGRTAAGNAEVDREQVRSQLISSRLAGYADGVLADLRAAATITGQ
ncbi:peptidylprolyl isomerase [Flavimaricola marinus]|uniref:Parvulin-like PPIase n=1 Tax=Flavimaricola marinus TaxID=1819565 RepID=A0A238LIW0_9RHOB|nr:peptidylprolyl isomerase [Flavimaricola marinus]SMY09619.1 Chaperone SurA precursor [Flavimaricola marinus]